MRVPEQQPAASSLLWVTLALIAAVGYAVSNTALGELALLGGIVARFY